MVVGLVYQRVDQDGEILPPNAPEPEVDPMQSWIDECIQAGETGDAVRWLIGKRVNQIVKRYGEDRVGYFAAKIHRAKSTIYEYGAVEGFYGNERTRYEFLESSPTVNYTHFRHAKSAAKRMGVSVDMAYKWLDNAARRERTPDQFSRVLTRYLRMMGVSKKKAKPVVKDTPCKIKDFDEANNIVCLQVQDDKAFAKLLRAFNSGQTDDLMLTLK